MYSSGNINWIVWNSFFIYKAFIKRWGKGANNAKFAGGRLGHANKREGRGCLRPETKQQMWSGVSKLKTLSGETKQQMRIGVSKLKTLSGETKQCLLKGVSKVKKTLFVVKRNSACGVEFQNYKHYVVKRNST